MSTQALDPRSWQPSQLKNLHYGSSSVNTHLPSSLPTPSSKAFIITTKSLAEKTPLVVQVESLLTSKHHAGTYSTISQHAPVAQLDEATTAVAKDTKIDTIISLGGGSPIDSAKAISYRLHKKTGSYLHHISIPTTLSAAECTHGAGYTSSSGQKIGVAAPDLAPHVILYDSAFALHTPPRLFASTGIRALDHAIEILYHPTATEVPAKALALSAIEALFAYLPLYHANTRDEDIITHLQLAAFASLYAIGSSLKQGLGLSHKIGYALGSPYGIPHGVTSCVSLPGVVRFKARDQRCAGQLARAVPAVGGKRTGDDRADAIMVGDRVEELVGVLGLRTNLGEYGVGSEQVGVIARTATGEEDGEAFEGVKGIIEEKL